MSASADTSEFGDLLQRLDAGDNEARKALIARSQERLRLRIHQMLPRFPLVHRQEETTDVLHDVVIELFDTLEKLTPRDSRHFLCLAAQHIRRRLIDLARNPRYRPGWHEMNAPADESHSPAGPSDHTHEPARLARWTEMHRYIHDLPEAERELFDLVFYQGLRQEEAAAVMRLPYRTFKRRWQHARLRLMNRFGSDPFGNR